MLATEGFLTLPFTLVAELAGADGLEVDELELFRAVCRWVQAEPVERAPRAEEVTRWLRCPLLSMAAIMKEVKPSGLVAPDQWLAALDYLAAPEEARRAARPDQTWQFTPRTGQLAPLNPSPPAGQLLGNGRPARVLQLGGPVGVARRPARTSTAAAAISGGMRWDAEATVLRVSAGGRTLHAVDEGWFGAVGDVQLGPRRGDGTPRQVQRRPPEISGS